MNGPLGFVCFTLGAGLVTVALRNLGNDSGPDFRPMLKEGIRAWKTITAAAGAAQTEFDSFQADLRAESTAAGAANQPRRRIRLEPPDQP